jgi:hypothetical protein
MSATTTPIACVWWSVTRCAWGCQIGNDRTWHYNERDAIRYGEQLAERVRLCSFIATT